MVVDGGGSGSVSSGNGVAVTGRVVVGVTVCEANVVSVAIVGGTNVNGGGTVDSVVTADAGIDEPGNVDNGSWVGVTVTIASDADVEDTVDVNAVLSVGVGAMRPVRASISTVVTTATKNRIAPRP